MKKISILLAALLTLGMLFVSTGCDEVEDAITNETADKWYKCTTNASVTSTSALTNIVGTYLYYDSSEKNLILLVASSDYYAEKPFDFGDARWNTLAIAASTGTNPKITQASNPKTNRNSTDDVNWGNIGTEFIIKTLLGGN